MSRATDLTDLGQGLAIGCLDLGVVGITSGKITLESAFRKAWHDWDPSYLYPHVDGRLDRNDIRFHIIGKSEGRRGAYLAAWEDAGRWLKPYLRGGLSIEEAAEAFAASTELRWEWWQELAASFLSFLDRDDYVRDGEQTRSGTPPTPSAPTSLGPPDT